MTVIFIRIKGCQMHESVKLVLSIGSFKLLLTVRALGEYIGVYFNFLQGDQVILARKCDVCNLSATAVGIEAVRLQGDQDVGLPVPAICGLESEVSYVFASGYIVS